MEDEHEPTSFPLYDIPRAEIEAIVRFAEYETIEDELPVFGTIPGFDGLWGHGRTQEDAEIDLVSALREWISLAVWRGQELPNIPGVALHVGEPV